MVTAGTDEMQDLRRGYARRIVPIASQRLAGRAGGRAAAALRRSVLVELLFTRLPWLDWDLVRHSAAAPSLQQPLLAEAEPTAVADNDVVVHHDGERASGGLDPLRHIDVVLGRGRVAARMVVDQPRQCAKSLIS
jgi:hypothetical protein